MVVQKDYLKTVSEQTLSIFKLISDKATEKLLHVTGNDPSTLVNNTLTGTQALANFNTISSSNRQGYEALKDEPAICRVKAINEDGEEETYYISRKSQLPLDNKAMLASYHSEIGRLASVQLGNEIQLNIAGRKQYFEILEKIQYHPSNSEYGWDSIDSTFQNSDFGLLSIDSLRALLEEEGFEDPDAVLERILSGGSDGSVTEGIKHQIRSSMQLRDQPILDQFQDEIFRLPLDSQLLILGPPGTGKTTTLIKRLGQKLDTEFLDEKEKPLVLSLHTALPHEQNWLMYTPTELLKLYVKEAFNREEVPASDQRIKTWESHRKELARNVLNILQSPTSAGKFVLKSSNEYLIEEIRHNPTEWFDALSEFHQQRMISQLTDGNAMLGKLENNKNKNIIEKISAVISNNVSMSLMSVYRELMLLEEIIKPLLKDLKIESDGEIRKGLALAVNTDKIFLDGLAKFLDTLQIEDDIENDEEFDDETSEEVIAPQNTAQKAQKAYNQTIRSIARAKFLKRSIPKHSKTAKITEWLGNRMPKDDILLSIGQNIAVQNGLRRFVNASKRYVSEVPASYREFRKNSFKQNTWYSGLPEITKHISSMELDAVVLLHLKTARKLLSQNYINNNIDDSRNTLLKIISDQFRNQILVDEATDFSPIQLACMQNLTNLKTQSFYACGDFNQRITSWGTRSKEQMEWVSNAIQMESINTIYRQSQKLNEFSGKLLEETNGSLDFHGKLPEYFNHIGVSPILLENETNIINIASWLNDRIQEVEKNVQQMPTIAVLVNSEKEVKPMADALNEVLEDISLNAVACADGKSLGQGNDVRVFDVQHIKGLEFEAVFFINIDMLAENTPDLFDKYIYVGSTRAATYLGMTCENRLPAKLEVLRDYFGQNWND